MPLGNELFPQPRETSIRYDIQESVFWKFLADGMKKARIQVYWWNVDGVVVYGTVGTTRMLTDVQIFIIHFTQQPSR